MAGLRLLGVLCAAVAVALVLSAAICLLPENDYQRWQLQANYMDGVLPRIYERIHFDPKPLDIAILGSSHAQLALSATAVEHQLAQHGKEASVVNLAIGGPGQNIQWAIVDELFKSKSLSRSKTQVVICPKRARNASSDGRRNSAGAINGAMAIHRVYASTPRLRGDQGVDTLTAALLPFHRIRAEGASPLPQGMLDRLGQDQTAGDASNPASASSCFSEESVGVFAGVKRRHFLGFVPKILVTRLLDSGKAVPSERID